MPRKHNFDPECLTLAEHFYPTASKDRLYDLAQRIQDQVEAEDIEQPAPETRVQPAACLLGATTHNNRSNSRG